MPRKPLDSKVTTSYTKAARTPSKRIRAKEIQRVPQGASPLATYIEENRDTGIPVSELIRQFQEYDCEHPQSQQEVMAAGSSYKFVRCAVCQRVEKRLKSHG
jgi:hypothetical protein